MFKMEGEEVDMCEQEEVFVFCSIGMEQAVEID